MIETTRRAALAGGFLLMAAPALRAQPRPPAGRLAAGLELAGETPGLRSLIVAQNGTPMAERVFRGGGLDRPTNIKSASKTILAMLAGIAIQRGVLRGLDQPVAPILGSRIPRDADPAVRRITLGNLLSMQAGLEPTSGANYGRWVSSRDWVGFALSRPMVDEPGGRMLYSTGTSHILAAVLARASGRSIRDLATEWLFQPLGHAVPEWTRDPQGLHFGGNEMAISPQALLDFGECCRNGGRHAGRQVIPEAFLRDSWRPRGQSFWSGQSYGLGWWIAEARGEPVVFAWGYGGQMVYLLPGLGLTVVMTSDADVPRVRGQVQTRHALLVEGILPAFTET
ncbi:serine hydrolase domain-containing protein [Falsiroseomonas tokyonensis]|uniref:Serine hydrolase domain-containing protein n=1 Tax=Falsiroseomonas tokyonensis TaxID=430521 RepID=A0ABV7BWM3_9PROT|nr:serine hydrolase [Falsiroseomonas tokyonensis]MBU8539942.1 serine hydrolase [Falsiroseomonas tokyonensis]